MVIVIVIMLVYLIRSGSSVTIGELYLCDVLCSVDGLLWPFTRGNHFGNFDTCLKGVSGVDVLVFSVKCLSVG